jgi:hypothetical protein
VPVQESGQTPGLTWEAYVDYFVLQYHSRFADLPTSLRLEQLELLEHTKGTQR